MKKALVPLLAPRQHAKDERRQDENNRHKEDDEANHETLLPSRASQNSFGERVEDADGNERQAHDEEGSRGRRGEPTWAVATLAAVR